MNRKLTISIICATLLSINLFGQATEDEVDSIINHIESFNESYYERISIKLNKEVYRPNDIIWFKASIRGYKKSISKSETLYVQLMSKDGSLIDIERFKILDGQASGQIIIDSLPPNKIYYLLFATHKSKANLNPLIKPFQISDFRPESSFDYSILNFESEPSKLNASISIVQDFLKFICNIKEDPLSVIILSNGEPIWAEDSDQAKSFNIAIPLLELESGQITYLVFQNTELIERGSIKINSCQSSLELVKSSNKNEFTIQLTNSNGLSTGSYAASIYLKELNSTLDINTINAVVNSGIKKSYQSAPIVKTDTYIVEGKVEPFKKNKTFNSWAMNIAGDSFHNSPVSADGSFIIELEKPDDIYIVGASDDKGNLQKIQLKDSIDFFYPIPSKDAREQTILNEQLITQQEQVNSTLKNYLDNQILSEIVVEGKNIKSEKPITKKTHNQTQLLSLYENIKTQEISEQRLESAGADDLQTIIKGFGGIRVLGNPSENGLFAYSTSRGVGSFGGSSDGAWPILFVVNGIRRGFDIAQLLDVLPINIKSIRLIRSTSAALQFGIEARGGAIVIETKDVNDISVVVADQETLTKSTYYYAEESAFVSTGSVESCISWESNMTLVDGKGQITFEQPILQGTYIFDISGEDEHGCYTHERIEINPELLR